jgi:ubiquinone/menaquinone biosynthesis C-methylase UbiE
MDTAPRRQAARDPTDTRNETSLTRKRYDRIAPIYDVIEWPMELRSKGWRHDLWATIPEGRVLEVGVGTGKNLPYHPPGREVVAIDISGRMLARAKARAVRLGVSVQLQEADAQALPFPDHSFDAVVASFVFCSVPAPLLGLREAHRVLRPGGRLELLEHVVSRGRVLGALMRWFDWLPARIWGAHIDRDTAAHVEAAGYAEVITRNLMLDIVQRISATR